MSITIYKRETSDPLLSMSRMWGSAEDKIIDLGRKEGHKRVSLTLRLWVPPNIPPEPRMSHVEANFIDLLDGLMQERKLKHEMEVILKRDKIPSVVSTYFDEIIILFVYPRHVNRHQQSGYGVKLTGRKEKTWLFTTRLERDSSRPVPQMYWLFLAKFQAANSSTNFLQKLLCCHFSLTDL